MKRPKFVTWLLQAESDLRSVADLIQHKHFAQACFNAQQAAEKALKALAFFRGSDLVKSHSLAAIAGDLKINGRLSLYSLKLDLYYLSARYPDALPDDAVPSERFSLELAQEAFEMAEVFILTVKQEIQK